MNFDRQDCRLKHLVDWNKRARNGFHLPAGTESWNISVDGGTTTSLPSVAASSPLNLSGSSHKLIEAARHLHHITQLPNQVDLYHRHQPYHCSPLLVQLILNLQS
jgi:hypothetical protein